MEGFTNMISANPWMLGIVFVAVGLLITVGAVLRWKWIVGVDGTTTTRTGLFGYIIYKLFGRRVFFIVMGAIITIAGIVWIIAMRALAA